MIFFIFYIVFSIPGTLLAKKYNPSTTISIGAMLWSIGATCQAGAMNPAGLYVCRALVGIGEAMFGQAIAFYFTCESRLLRADELRNALLTLPCVH